MPRYEELCQSCDVALKNYYEHKDRVDQFVRERFLPGLIYFLECPEDKVWIFDFNNGWERLALSKVMLADDECYWTLGVAIRMERARGFMDIGYLLRCRGIDGRFTIEIAERTFVIDNDTDLERCFQHIFWHIKHKNEGGLHEAIRGGPARKIGFSQ
jgi:hypothetical protein